MFDQTHFVNPMPAQLVFGHLTLLNDDEEFLQGLDSAIEFSSEHYEEQDQLSAKALCTELLEMLSKNDTPLPWRLGYIIGEVVGLLHPDLEPQDPALSYLEALAQRSERCAE